MQKSIDSGESYIIRSKDSNKAEKCGNKELHFLLSDKREARRAGTEATQVYIDVCRGADNEANEDSALIWNWNKVAGADSASIQKWKSNPIRKEVSHESSRIRRF